MREFTAKYLYDTGGWGEKSCDVIIVLNKGFMRITDTKTHSRNLYARVQDITAVYDSTEPTHSLTRSATGAIIGGLAGGVPGMFLGTYLGSGDYNKKSLCISFYGLDGKGYTFVVRTYMSAEKLRQVIQEMSSTSPHHSSSRSIKHVVSTVMDGVRSYDIPEDDLKTTFERHPVIIILISVIIGLVITLIMLYLIGEFD